MHDGQPPAQTIYWPRVKVILDGIMDRWQTRWGREPYEGIHEYRWDTPQQLAIAVLSGYRAIEPGVCGCFVGLAKPRVAGAVDQFARSQLRIELRK